MTRTTTAHAPGSVTLAFAPTRDGQGSRGISLTTADGVEAEVRPADDTRVWLDGEATAFEPVEGVLERLGVAAAVELTAATPVGAGFGASGAATLATALAANAAFDLGRDRSALVEAAARAEVAAGTGLGDVFVQNRGGLVYDTGDGRRRRARTGDLQYVSHGGITTADVLGDEAAMERVRAAATDAFAAFDPSASLSTLLSVGRTFTDRTGLATDRVQETFERVAAAGGTATAAMVGETVVATGAGDTLPNATRLTDTGARLR